MVSIRDTLRAALGADPVVAGLVGDRIYPGEIPDHDTPAPFVYYVVTEQETTDQHDATDHNGSTVEFDCFAETYEAALDLRAAVRSVVYCYAGGQIDKCLYRTGREEVVEGGYRLTLTIGVWGDDASIVPDGPGRPRVTVADGGLYLGSQLIVRAVPSLKPSIAGETAAVTAIASLLETQGVLSETVMADAALPRVQVREDGLYFGGVMISPLIPPSLTYSRSAAGETPAVAAIRVALAEQGLILDLTTA